MSKRNIRNPEKWIGRKVRHMANWMDFQWGDQGYFVCEETGKLFRMEDEYKPCYEEHEIALAVFDEYPLYYYSEEGFNHLIKHAA